MSRDLIGRSPPARKSRLATRCSGLFHSPSGGSPDRGANHEVRIEDSSRPWESRCALVGLSMDRRIRARGQPESDQERRMGHDERAWASVRRAREHRCVACSGVHSPERLQQVGETRSHDRVTTRARLPSTFPSLEKEPESKKRQRRQTFRSSYRSRSTVWSMAGSWCFGCPQRVVSSSLRDLSRIRRESRARD